MGGFLKSKFQNKLDNNSEKELKRLLSNPKAQEKDLIDFFKAKIPELPQFLEKYLIEYKMLFVISVYEAKIAELEKRLEETNDSLTANELSIWKNILELAKNDDWDEVIKLLQF